MILRNIKKSFGKKSVLSSFSLSVRKGERISLYGESGEGKTTVLDIMLGLIKPDEGEIDLEGDTLSAVFQEDRLIENISVINNLILVTEDRNKALIMLSSLGLEGEENSRTESLSGGMKRRLSIARALLYPSSILLLDEPFTGLDEENKKKCASLILNSSSDRAIVLVTHSKEDEVLLKIERRVSISNC
ncbi:MAG TPA: ATP-binding cassette domain-containing protein [Candidatus Ornithospirochaeta avicola]|uniref:ATP-binding cassette domain-containing protein n=1 Tax=Candidatus Ornithospirochaeta avicola TaxID=2840896 RepID=A0A9D1TMK1_9SPIO|nr:ATP-binding cassette domain-containing protein [Candidatus Ornithospirochaeta avicola]